MQSPANLLDEVVVGNDAAWIIEFCTAGEDGTIGDSVLTRGRDDYYAAIEASMASDLTGGRYHIVIEHMTDDDYQKIADKQAPVMKLYLFWRDNNQSLAGYAANVAGVGDMLKGVSNTPDDSTLVAVLGVTKIARKRGALTYDVEIEAREWVFDRLDALSLDETDVSQAETDKKIVDYMTALTTRKNVSVEGNAFDEALALAGGQELGDPVVETFNTLAQRMELETRKFGRGMFLIRDGKLIIGDRNFPYKQDNSKNLTIQGGLIEINKMPDFDNKAKDGPRPQYQLLLKGRPDIKPGGVVRIVPPPHEEQRTLAGKFGIVGDLASSLVGGLVDSITAFDADNAINLYVMTVTHQQSKTAGFATTVVGVKFDPAEPWDTMTVKTQQAGIRQMNNPSATGEGRLANAISSRARTALNHKRYADVGQVRLHTPNGDNPRRHTIDVWRGTSLTGRDHESVRNAFLAEESSRFTQVPIVSPFAWGQCGLILPRYPGMRVVMVHRNGALSDALDVGAVWEWDSGNPGPDANPGDYWLALPAAVPSNERTRLDDDAEPSAYTGIASNDLIDADGSRIIEVGELIIRVGDMKSAGTRPARPPEDDEQRDSITIEHVAAGSKIMMKQDGTIVIQGTNIEIDAGNGNITMKAENVNVEVGNAMDVTSG